MFILSQSILNKVPASFPVPVRRASDTMRADLTVFSICVRSFWESKVPSGNAATALATMIGTKVDMTVPKVELVEFSEMGEALGGEEQIMAGIYLQISGDITGSIMFLLEEKSAHDLVSRLMGGGEAVFEEGQPFNEMEQSALSEIGNIIVGSYLNSLSMLTGLKIIESVPSLAMDMAEVGRTKAKFPHQKRQ